jgi:hypothetical protein
LGGICAESLQRSRRTSRSCSWGARWRPPPTTRFGGQLHHEVLSKRSGRAIPAGCTCGGASDNSERASANAGDACVAEKSESAPELSFFLPASLASSPGSCLAVAAVLLFVVGTSSWPRSPQSRRPSRVASAWSPVSFDGMLAFADERDRALAIDNPSASSPRRQRRRRRRVCSSSWPRRPRSRHPSRVASAWSPVSSDAMPAFAEERGGALEIDNAFVSFSRRRRRGRGVSSSCWPRLPVGRGHGVHLARRVGQDVM